MARILPLLQNVGSFEARTEDEKKNKLLFQMKSLFLMLQQRNSNCANVVQLCWRKKVEEKIISTNETSNRK
jgi:hypothetical protein